jgi:hypothetical protein
MPEPVVFFLVGLIPLIWSPPVRVSRVMDNDRFVWLAA